MNSAKIEEAIGKGAAAQKNRDLETAKKEYRNAIDLGSKKALCYLGDIYLREKNKDKAFELYQNAADGGEPLGYTHIGRYYDDLHIDSEMEGDLEKAQEYLKIAASYYEKAYRGKEVYATFMLATFYKFGQGVDTDKEKAVSMYNELIQGNDIRYKAMAYLELAREYIKYDKFVDEEKGLDLLYKSAELDCVNAYEQLAKITSKKGDMALANAYYKKAAEMYRERNMEYMATAAEKSIVPCDLEVEPFIRRTLSDENKKAENKETANSESIEKPADCKAADKPLADNEENDLDKILSDENVELLKLLNDEFLEELEKEKILRMLKAYEKEKIHIGTFLKKNADKPDEGYDVILLDFTDSEQRKKMETFFLSNYLNITFDEGKRLVNNMPCVISSGLSIAKAIDTYFRLSEIQFVLAIARDNIIFDLDRVSLVESVEYKNDINTDDVVELLKSLAPNSYRA